MGECVRPEAFRTSGISGVSALDTAFVSSPRETKTLHVGGSRESRRDKELAAFDKVGLGCIPGRQSGR